MLLTDFSNIIYVPPYGDETFIKKIYLGDDGNIIYPKMGGKDFKISEPKEREKNKTYCLGNADGYLKTWTYSSGTRTSINTSYDEIMKIKLEDNDYYDFNCGGGARKWYDLSGNELFYCFVCNNGYPHLVDDSDEDAYYEFYSDSKSENVLKLNRGGSSSDGYHLMYLYEIEKI